MTNCLFINAFAPNDKGMARLVLSSVLTELPKPLIYFSSYWKPVIPVYRYGVNVHQSLCRSNSRKLNSSPTDKSCMVLSKFSPRACRYALSAAVSSTEIFIKLEFTLHACLGLLFQR